MYCSLFTGSRELPILLSPSVAHCKGAAGSLLVIASAYHLCSVHVLCVCMCAVCCNMLCVPCMFVWQSVLCEQEHTFHP